MTLAGIEVFVLSGGKSSRMGRDKGMVPLNGKPMISYILKTLNDVDLPITIIANDTGYESFGYRVIPDVVMEKGPIGGLLTAFENTEAQAVLLISCDMPFIPKETIRNIIEAGEPSTIVAAQTEKRINPLLALYPVNFKEEVKARISTGRLKMTDFILENKHKLVTSGAGKEEQNFRNINTQQELREAEKRWNNYR